MKQVPGGQDGDVTESHCCGLGAVPDDLLAKVTGVTRGPRFPGWGPEKPLQVCLLGSSVLAGPSGSADLLSGPASGSPGLGTAVGKSHHSPGVAGFYL